jgi:hypothetical protein
MNPLMSQTFEDKQLPDGRQAFQAASRPHATERRRWLGYAREFEPGIPVVCALIGAGFAKTGHGVWAAVAIAVSVTAYFGFAAAAVLTHRLEAWVVRTRRLDRAAHVSKRGGDRASTRFPRALAVVRPERAHCTCLKHAA